MLNKDFYNLESLYYVGLSQYLHFDKSKNKLNVTGPQNLAFFLKCMCQPNSASKKRFQVNIFIEFWPEGMVPFR